MAQDVEFQIVKFVESKVTSTIAIIDYLSVICWSKSTVINTSDNCLPGLRTRGAQMQTRKLWALRAAKVWKIVISKVIINIYLLITLYIAV